MKTFYTTILSIALIASPQLAAAESESCQKPRFSNVGWTDTVATTSTAMSLLTRLGIPLLLSAFDAVCPGGQVISVGISNAGAELCLLADEMVCTGKTVVGCYYSGANPSRDFPMLINLFRHNKILLDELVEEVIPFEKIADGFARMQSGTLLGRLVAKLN